MKRDGKLITVAILINDEIIGLKYAVRMGEPDMTRKAQYRTDCNRIIEHYPKDGAKVLAKKMIDLLDLGTPFADLPKDKQINFLMDLIHRKVKQ